MKILIVDDEPVNRFMLRHMLEEQGYPECEEACDGIEALEVAERFDPDLVLLDVMMPRMNGFDTAAKLKFRAKDFYLPIIFITALEDRDSLVKCLESGGDDFFSKPFDKVILQAKIKAQGRIRSLSKRIEQQNTELRYFRHSIDREHAIVEYIFSNAIVNNPIALPFFDAKVASAADFNGDLFLCEVTPRGGLYILVGDFTGHGLASAIGALPVTRAFQAMAAKGLSISEMVSTINGTVASLLPPDMFFAAALIEVASDGKRLNIWNGGIPPLMLKSADGKIVRKFRSRHLALGILDDEDFDSDCESFEASMGDKLLAYSDGLMEIVNDDGEMLDEVGVERWFVESDNISSESLYQRALQYMGGAQAQDDITIGIYECKDLASVKRDIPVSIYPFQVSFLFESEQLRQNTALDTVLNMLNSQKGMNILRSELYTVLSEIFNNALEHGVLNLESKMKRTPEGFLAYYEERESRLQELKDGWVKLDMEYNPKVRQLMIRVLDSGDGFAHEKLASGNDDNGFGRGISIIKKLCSSVSFSKNGRQIEVVLEL